MEKNENVEKHIETNEIIHQNEENQNKSDINFDNSIEKLIETQIEVEQAKKFSELYQNLRNNELHRFFKQLDLDSDGKISEAELGISMDHLNVSLCLYV